MTKEEKKAALLAKKAERKEKKAGGSASATPSGSVADLASLSLEAEEGHSSRDKHAISRTVTGVLTSRPTSRDIKIDSFSMGLNGVQLIQDCSIELTIGRRRVRGRGRRDPRTTRAPPVARCRASGTRHPRIGSANPGGCVPARRARAIVSLRLRATAAA